MDSNFRQIVLMVLAFFGIYILMTNNSFAVSHDTNVCTQIETNTMAEATFSLE